MNPATIWGNVKSNVKTFFSSKIWGNFVTVFSSVAKATTGPAQSYTIIKTTLKYSNSTSTPLLVGLASGGIALNLGFNLLSKIPAIKQVFNKSTSDQQTPAPDMATLGKAGKITYISLQAAELLSGGLQSALSYYSGLVFIKDLVNGICIVFNIDSESEKVATIANVLAQTIYIPAAIGTFGSYFSFDHKNIQLNAFQLANSVDQRDFSFDKAIMAKTLASAGLNLVSYAAISFAWTFNFIENSPAKTLPAWASYSIAGFLCLDTGITVALWLPSVYRAFDQSKQVADNNAAEPLYNMNDCLPRTVRGAVIATGVGDSLVNSGENVFNSMTFTANRVFHLNPYHPAVIAFSGVCALHATIGNIFFSVLPGHIALLDILHSPKSQIIDVESGEREPLLRVSAKNPNRFFTDAKPATEVEPAASALTLAI